MPELRLEDYLKQVAGLIDNGQPVDAVRHCRNILDQYPRHVQTYKLLGKALLEQGLLEDASDIFQRVLSTDPSDFLAHAGMAILYKEQDRLEQAVWHMERAFEVEPFNAAIRDALNDLYGRRDGSPAIRLMLTRGALARLYVEGGLYSLAIAELEELLARENDRTDLQLLLAEALWRDGQRVDAVDLSMQIVEQLPDCVAANAILAEVWLLTGRSDEAQDHLRRVYRMVLPTAEMLEGDDPVAAAFRANDGFSVPADTMVEPLSDRVTAGAPAEMGEWLQDVDFDEGVDLEEADPEWLEALQGNAEALSGVEDDAVADWLRQVAAQTPPESSRQERPHERPEAAKDGTPAGEDDESPSPSDAHLEGGEALAWSEESEAGGKSRPEEAAEWPDQPSDQLPGIGELSEETDWEDWLEDERQAGDPRSATESPPDSSVLEEVGMGASDERDEFHDQVPEGATSDVPEEEPFDLSGGDPEWLDELEAASTGPSQADDRAPDEEQSLPDWLEEDAAILDETGEALAWLGDKDADSETADPGESPAREVPDWLDEESSDSLEVPEIDVEDELGWLDQIAAGEGAPIEEPPTMSWPESEDETVGAESTPPAPESSDEVREVTEAGAQEPEMASEPHGRPQDEEQDSVPDAFEARDSSGEISIDEVPEDLEGAMEWMEQLAAQEGEAYPEMPTLDDLSEEDEEALLGEMPEDLDEAMSWLSDLSQEQASEEPAVPRDDEAAQEAEGVEGDEPPDWLAEFVDEEEEEPEPETSDEGLALAPDAAAQQVEDVAPGDDWLDEAEEVEQPEAAEEEGVDWLADLAGQGEVGIPAEQEDAAAEVAPQEEAVPEGEEPLMGQPDEVRPEDEPVSEEEVPEELEGAMAWLEQLAAKQGASLDELPSLQQGDAEQAPDEETEAEPMQAEDAELDWIDAMSDEGELADEWLDEPSGDREERPAGKVGSVEARPEPGEAEEAVDPAMHWLDELAESPVSPRSELPAREAPPASEGSPEEDLEDLGEIPEDPEAALAWLESLARGDVAAAQDAETVEEQPTPPVPHDVTEARAEAEAILLRDQEGQGAGRDEEILDEMPEDPDEAMDWLERLAARQGASLDELPSVDRAEGEVETPEWIAQEIEQEEQEVPPAEAPAASTEEISGEPEQFVDDSVDEDVEDQASSDEGEGIAGILAEEEWIDEEEFLTDLDLDDEELDETLPEWLAIEDEADSDDFAWDEVTGDVAGWLEAEDEATRHEIEIPDAGQPEIGESAPPRATAAEHEEREAPLEGEEGEAYAPEEEAWPVGEEVQPPPAPAFEGLDSGQFQAARQALDAGDADSALNTYRDLLEAGRDLSLLIGELEVASATHPAEPRLLRLLGDAYMENGQLQRALDAYRGALDTI